MKIILRDYGKISVSTLTRDFYFDILSRDINSIPIYLYLMIFKNKTKLLISILTVLYYAIAYTSNAMAGCTNGDCTNGQGTYIYPDGSVYAGQWENDKFDGQGTFTYSDGSVYIGQWENSLRNGQGTFTRPSGSKYQGQWKNDKFDGQGIYIYAGGSKYKGQWKNNMRNGPGIYTSASGSKYQGQWKNGKLIGKGILFTSDGNKFVGYFNKDGKLIKGYIPLSEAEGRAKPEAKEKAEIEVSRKAEIEASRKAEIEANRKADASLAMAKAEVEEMNEAKHVKKDETKKEVRVEARTQAKPKATPGKKTFAVPNGIKFVYISPGTFKMGSPKAESGRYDNEIQHQVTLTQGFYMQITEVTQGQWRSLMGNNPSFFNGCGDDCPVEQVSWSDVQQFIWRLNQLEGGKKYRLPTEAEWEYACRAGSATAFASGEITALECDNDSNLADVAWFCGNSAKTIHPVALKKPNAWGLYDMHGNVSELCQDWYGEYPPDLVSDPEGPASGIDHSVRGGGWDSYARHCRTACRGAISSGQKIFDVGFRIVKMP